MAKKIELKETDLNHHSCQSWHEGDWVYFHCPACAFQRKLNWKTGELVLIKAGDERALHKGMNTPIQAAPQDLLLN